MKKGFFRVWLSHFIETLVLGLSSSLLPDFFPAAG